MNDILTYIEQNQERFLEELYDFLRIPSVSTDPDRKEDVGRAAEFVSGAMKQAGFDQVEIVPTPGHPIVFGQRIVDPSRPTVLVYGHYDVQPEDPLDEWDSPPFEPSLRGDELFARGAADDKGQMWIHFKSAEAYQQVRGELPVNLKFLIEGEEEIGSPNLDPFIDARSADLAADTVMISDTTMFAKGIPSICYGLRGLAYVEVQVVGPNRDLHSGSFGGAVANPAHVLADLISSLKDDRQRITIPGFYDNVRELTQSEREEFASLPFEIEDYKADLGVAELCGEEGFTPLEQLWGRPTLEVNGMLSGFTGEGAKTVIPSRAMAKISMRLVPDQDPDRIATLIEEHLLRIAPASVKIQVVPMHGGWPWVAALDHPALRAAASAIELGYGARPVFQREGGSIPVVATFADKLKIPSVLMGIGLPDENIHAPNEKLNVENFYGGIRASAHFYDELAKIGQG